MKSGRMAPWRICILRAGSRYKGSPKPFGSFSSLSIISRKARRMPRRGLPRKPVPEYLETVWPEAQTDELHSAVHRWGTGPSLRPLALDSSMDFFHLGQDLSSGHPLFNFRIPLQVGRGKLLAHLGVKGLKFFVLFRPRPLGILILTLGHDLSPFRTCSFTIIDQEIVGKRDWNLVVWNKPMFTLSAFADEIDPDPQQQIDVLKSCGVRHIELRSILKTNVLD